jgi:hypothetical protein
MKYKEKAISRLAAHAAPKQLASIIALVRENQDANEDTIKRLIGWTNATLIEFGLTLALAPEQETK